MASAKPAFSALMMTLKMLRHFGALYVTRGSIFLRATCAEFSVEDVWITGSSPVMTQYMHEVSRQTVRPRFNLGNRASGREHHAQLATWEAADISSLGGGAANMRRPPSGTSVKLQRTIPSR